MRNKNNENYFQKNNTVITGESSNRAKALDSDKIAKQIDEFVSGGGMIEVIAPQNVDFNHVGKARAADTMW